MIALTRKLLERGFAYEKLRSVYFDISRFKDYGRLSGVDLSKIRVGKTVDLDEYAKENPRDFTLLKRAKLSELKKGLYYTTPWGQVRPSWHLESAAMALKHLNETVDFHVGGVESLFPHDENENALFTAATGKPLANAWLHCERVLKDGRPLKEASQSRSGTSPPRASAAPRCASSCWPPTTASPWPSATTNLKAAAQARARLDHFLERLSQVAGDGPVDAGHRRAPLPAEKGVRHRPGRRPQHLPGPLHPVRPVGEFNTDLDRGTLGHAAAAAILSRLPELDEVLGIMNRAAGHRRAGRRDRGPVQAREEARKRRDWAGRRPDPAGTGRPGHRPHRHPRRPPLAPAVRVRR